MFPETLEALCGQAQNAPAKAAEYDELEPPKTVQPDPLAATAAAFAAMGQPSEQRYLPLHLLHSGTRTYH
ncbi:MAG: hypothetical protein O2881_05440 [Proteobacteria bacterium]|nr:hypothetical protein [Pseudomonadota bacterium]MDA0876722.1 hypothetical protein [Pseudomonadota bacterium]MDA1186432.1 hypothetical protein [Pseudomonadota bacterium]